MYGWIHIIYAYVYIYIHEGYSAREMVLNQRTYVGVNNICQYLLFEVSINSKKGTLWWFNSLLLLLKMMVYRCFTC
jgi:hypothetical protein